MRRLLALLALCFSGVVAPAQRDAAGSRDHHLFPRHPLYYISQYKVMDSVPYKSELSPGTTLTGKSYLIEYRLKENAGGPVPDKLALIRFYEQRFRSLPGKKNRMHKGLPGRELFSGALLKGNYEHWINVSYWEFLARKTDTVCSGYRVQILEHPLVKELAPAEIGTALKSAGRVALDIEFSSGSAAVGEVSVQQCIWLAQALQKDPALRVSIEGHTDNRGKEGANQALSEQRATAVRDFIVKYGVSRERVTTKGWGSQKPVATNSSAEGRARNRRVEIVKR